MKTSRTAKRQNSVPSQESETEIVERLKRLPTDHRKRSQDAHKRLGVKKEDVDACLKITPRLREVGLTAERVVEILDSDDTEDGRKFVARYRAISKSDRAYLSIEEICVAAGLTTRRLWEVISGARL